MIYFSWKELSSFEPEVELFLLPGDCSFVRVPECKDARCYVLKFASSAKRYFFWLQSTPKQQPDEEIARRCDEILSAKKPFLSLPDQIIAMAKEISSSQENQSRLWDSLPTALHAHELSLGEIISSTAFKQAAEAFAQLASTLSPSELEHLGFDTEPLRLLLEKMKKRATK